MTQTHIYPLSYLQLQGVTEYLSALNSVDSASTEPLDPEVQFGDGFYATIKTAIPIRTDANSADELLGWIVRGDHDWLFTQDPACAGMNPAIYFISTQALPHVEGV